MATNPLHDLEQQIASAAVLPAAEPYVRSTAPLERLRTLWRGAAANDDASTEPATAPNEFAGATSGLDAIVGREVLEVLSRQPLGGPARAEAIRRLVIALQNPSADNVRAALGVLLAGDPEV